MALQQVAKQQLCISGHIALTLLLGLCASTQPVALHSQKLARVPTRILLLQNLPPGIQLPANSGEVVQAMAAAMANASELQQAMDRLASAAAQSQQSIAAAAAAGGLSVLPLQLPGPDGPQLQQQQQMANQQAQGQVRWWIYEGHVHSDLLETPHMTCREAKVQLLPRRRRSHQPLSVQLTLAGILACKKAQPHGLHAASELCNIFK